MAESYLPYLFIVTMSNKSVVFSCENIAVLSDDSLFFESMGCDLHVNSPSTYYTIPSKPVMILGRL